MAVTDASFIQPAGGTVDVGGTARVQFNGTGQALLSWGYGAAYHHEATIIGGKKSATIENVFAKGGAACTGLVLRGAHGEVEKCEFPLSDGTVEMLAYVNQARSNAEMKETLWHEVEQQARLMQQVGQRAGE